jgi:hypothetical protein
MGGNRIMSNEPKGIGSLTQGEAGEFKNFNDEWINKPNKTDQYTKVSLDVRKDLNDRLNRLTRLFARGWKTEAVNVALERFIEDTEATYSESLENLDNAGKNEDKARNKAKNSK